MIAGLFRSPSTGSNTVFGFKTTGGSSFGTHVYAPNVDAGLFNIASLKTVQIGKSNQVVTRQDFKLIDAFSTSPESNTFGNLSGGYNSGLGLIEIPATLSNLGGSGTIKEIVKYATLRNENNSGANTIIFFRDLVADVTFIQGESLNIIYEVLI